MHIMKPIHRPPLFRGLGLHGLLRLPSELSAAAARSREQSGGHDTRHPPEGIMIK